MCRLLFLNSLSFHTCEGGHFLFSFFPFFGLGFLKTFIVLEDLESISIDELTPRKYQRITRYFGGRDMYSSWIGKKGSHFDCFFIFFVLNFLHQFFVEGV